MAGICRHIVLLAATVALLGGCAAIPAPRTAPELPVAMDFEFTEGVPEEQPLPPLRTEGLGANEVNTIRIYRERHRAVVNVTAIHSEHTPLRGTVHAAGTGSGFIIDQRGTVITNHHVVTGGERLVVTLYDGSHYPARLVGSDPEMDLAVLRIDAHGRQLTTIPIGDSTRLQVGQKVLALGNPFGLEGSLTTGVISALERPVQTPSGFIMRDLIQTDAAINPGNSGGPLLDSRGDLIGVNSMMVSPLPGGVGIGLAIPAHTTERIVEQILREGRVVRGWIQIEGVALSDRLARAGDLPIRRGILVTRVLPGGNAEAAGLRDGVDGRHVRHGPYRIPVDGDIIVEIDGQRTGSVGELFASLEATRPEQRVVLTILRDGEYRDIAVVLAARPHAGERTAATRSRSPFCGPICRRRLAAEGREADTD